MLMKVNVERLREGVLLRVIYVIQLAFHTQDLEIITNNDRAEAYSIGSPTFSKMVECGLLVVGHKKPPTLPGGK